MIYARYSNSLNWVAGDLWRWIWKKASLTLLVLFWASNTSPRNLSFFSSSSTRAVWWPFSLFTCFCGEGNLLLPVFFCNGMVDRWKDENGIKNCHAWIRISKHAKNCVKYMYSYLKFVKWATAKILISCCCKSKDVLSKMPDFTGIVYILSWFADPCMFQTTNTLKIYWRMFKTLTSALGKTNTIEVNGYRLTPIFNIPSIVFNRTKKYK